MKDPQATTTSRTAPTWRSRIQGYRPLAAAAALLALAGGTLALGTAAPQAAQAAQTAQATGSCWGGPTVTTYLGNRDSMHVCPTWTGTNVYLYTHTGNWVQGYLYAGTNWFYCQKWGSPNPQFGTSSFNQYWLYTQGDVDTANGPYGTDAWGWAPATAVSYGDNNKKVPGVPLCPADFTGN